MSTVQSGTRFLHEADKLSVRIVTDPGDRTERPWLRKPRIAIHLGRSVYMGVPVHRDIIQRRAERARTLLTHGKLSISEVAHEAGFSHQSHVAIHMRRILGCTPRSARYLHRTSDDEARN